MKERVLYRSTKKSAARTAANIADLDNRDTSLLNFAMQNAYKEQWGQGMLQSQTEDGQAQKKAGGNIARGRPGTARVPSARAV